MTSQTLRISLVSRGSQRIISIDPRKIPKAMGVGVLTEAARCWFGCGECLPLSLFFCGTGFGWGKVLYTEFHEAFGVLKFQKGKRQNIFEEMGQSWSFALGVLWNSKKINLCHITSSIFLNRSCLAVEDAWFHWNFFGCDVSQASRLIWPSFTGTRLCKWSKSNRIPLDWWHPEFSELNIASLWMIHHKPPISWWREICSVNLEATLLAPGHRALLGGGRIESQHFRWGSQLFDLLVYTT